MKQQYLPDPLKNRVYYEYGENKLNRQPRIIGAALKNSLDQLR